MPKKKEKKAVRLPKIVAGVKIPKALRDQGHNIAKFARNPLVADILAAGLVALAATLRDNKQVKKAAAKATDTVEQVAEKVEEAAKATTKKAAKATKAAATVKAATGKTPTAKAPAAKKPAAPPRPRAPRRPPSKTTH
jgi:hypothetical protein